MDYQEFIDSKKHLSGFFGFDPVFMPNLLFDFQKYLVTWALKKGRCALYVDTGLGKTIMQLTIAENIVRKTNKRVLILTPLAVAFQFLLEAEKIDITDIEYSKNGKFTKKIVITNYERLNHFNSNDFEGLILDESSILKNFEGSIKNSITSFVKNIKYRFLSTATPSPNDFTELGTSSEALGYLGYMDMLTKFFKNNEDTIDPLKIGTEWVLKSHAKEHFWQWVSGWSKSIRKPSDIGFNDDKFILPELIINTHKVRNNSTFEINGQLAMFNTQSAKLSDVRIENKNTLNERCEKAINLASKHDISVYWCNLNNESDLIEKLDKDSVQIKGSMDIDKKENILLAFSKGEIKKLITKPKITAFGLNWQHCNHTVYFPTFSYEQYYQSIRRFWRFGQKRKVIVDLVTSDGQDKVITALREKSKKADELFSNLNENINKSFDITLKGFDKKIILPTFLR
jgi:hypothetical protein